VSVEESRLGSAGPNRGRLQTLAPIAVFDVIGPLVAYYSLRSAGLSSVAALVLSGVLPACGVALKIVRHRSVDAIGILVLIGIVVGTALGLASGNAHLVLLDGTVPTVVFGAVCLGSLWSSRPLMFLAEAAAQVLVIETSSTGTAKATSNVMPLAFAAIVVAWNISYAKRGRRQGELAADAARARGDAPPAMPTER